MLEKMGGFFCFSWFEITPPIVSPLMFVLSLLIKWFLPVDLTFHLIFLYFLMFLLLTCRGVCLVVGFCVGKSDGNSVSIKQRSLIGMFY